MKNPYRIVFVLMSLFCLAGCDMGLTEEEVKEKIKLENSFYTYEIMNATDKELKIILVKDTDYFVETNSKEIMIPAKTNCEKKVFLKNYEYGLFDFSIDISPEKVNFIDRYSEFNPTYRLICQYIK